ncbi:unnamed protein product [Phyllotreta striolata]|uniref:Odorant receptor n=1 Tax=Phyllotreta striolata TaxID=444603 RepID=A0A9N9TZB6_PHYSR|nr:unnamed protein product [Phyllotreta striolata]
MDFHNFRFSNITNVSVNFLLFFGILHPKFNSAWVVLKYVIRVSTIMGFLFGGMVLSEILKLLHSLNDLEKLMDSLFLTVTNLVSIVKFISIVRNERKIMKLLAQIDKREFRPKSQHQKNILESNIKAANVIALIVYSGCFVTVLFWVISAVIGDEVSLPVPSYIPFELTSTPVFVITFIYESIATLIGGFSNLSADCLMISFVIVISAQFNILNDTIENLERFCEEEFMEKRMRIDRRSPEFQNLMNKKLIGCIEHYQCITEFSKTTNDLFSVTIFLQLFLSIVIISSTLYEISTGSITSQVKTFSMCAYLFCILGEIFPVCYFANEINEGSSRLTTSAYTCDWVDCSVEFKKNLLTFMTRTQKILRLYAGNFVEISLQMFMKIIKSSWSYWAVINQVDK